jgi:hypothetical protein
MAVDSVSYIVAGTTTVSDVAPEIFPTAAEIVVIPAVRAVASPEASMVAAVVFDDAHVAVVVMSFVVWSLYVPVAWNWTLLPAGVDELDGVTTMDLRTAAVTVSVTVVECVADPLVPVIVIVFGPPEALVVTVNVEFPDPVIVAGVKVAMAPVGNPLAFKFTPALKPFNDPTEME